MHTSCATKKGSGGCFVRLLKKRLEQHLHVTREVFLDLDNLQDLSALFGIVGNRIDALVREMATACSHRPREFSRILAIVKKIPDFGFHVNGLEFLAE